MCGLYGSITQIQFNKTISETDKKLKKEILISLALSMEERGIDSAGIAGVSGMAGLIAKEAEPAHEFIKSKMFNDVIDKNFNVIIGHTRQATTGVINDENSHPFKEGEILGCHNGVVNNYLEINEKVEVDSEAIFTLLNKNKNNFKKTFKKLSGSFAISWLSLNEPDTLYLVVSGNPLFVMYSLALKSYFYASTELSLKSLSPFCNGKEVWQVPENIVYKITGDLKIKKTPIKFKEPDYDFGYLNKSYYADEEEKDTPLYYTINYGYCESCQEQMIDKINAPIWYDKKNDLAVCSKCFNDYPMIGEWEYISSDELKAQIEPKLLLRSGLG